MIAAVKHARTTTGWFIAVAGVLALAGMFCAMAIVSQSGRSRVIEDELASPEGRVTPISSMQITRVPAGEWGISTDCFVTHGYIVRSLGHRSDLGFEVQVEAEVPAQGSPSRPLCPVGTIGILKDVEGWNIAITEVQRTNELRRAMAAGRSAKP